MQRDVQRRHVPLRRIHVLGNQPIHDMLHAFRNHVVDGVAHALTVEHAPPLGVNDFPLLVHHLVILQQVLADAKVVALNLLLRRLNRARQHLVLYLVAVLHAQRVEHVHQPLRSEQAHQVVFQ